MEREKVEEEFCLEVGDWGMGTLGGAQGSGGLCVVEAHFVAEEFPRIFLFFIIHPLSPLYDVYDRLWNIVWEVVVFNS